MVVLAVRQARMIILEQLYKKDENLPVVPTIIRDSSIGKWLRGWTHLASYARNVQL